jgi:hypothetical protein
VLLVGGSSGVATISDKTPTLGAREHELAREIREIGELLEDFRPIPAAEIPIRPDPVAPSLSSSITFPGRLGLLYGKKRQQVGEIHFGLRPVCLTGGGRAAHERLENLQLVARLHDLIQDALGDFASPRAILRCISGLLAIGFVLPKCNNKQKNTVIKSPLIRP